VAAAAKRIRGRSSPGSSTRNGRLYHDIPFAGLGKIPHHRPGTAKRVKQITDLVKVRGKRVLDIGCSAGGVSIGLALAGAKSVEGIDLDGQALAVAEQAAKAAGVANRVRFRRQSFDLRAARDLGRYDVVVWLSQWMWTVKQQGLEKALDALHAVSRKASVLVFESAASDGEAGIPGSSQRKIAGWLRASVAHERIKSVPSPGGWHKRRLFVCTRPRLNWKGHTSEIVRLSRGTILKSYSGCERWPWMASHEAEALGWLDGRPGFPRLIDFSGQELEISWCGWPSAVVADMEPQAEGLLTAMRDTGDGIGIRHRDVRPSNLTALGSRLHLIDFGWALLGPQHQTPDPPPGCFNDREDHKGKWSAKFDDAQAFRNVFRFMRGEG
jgi:SAM-dependent methyltransferase